MKMRKPIRNVVFVFMLMTMGLLLPQSTTAQSNGLRGLFGKGDETIYEAEEDVAVYELFEQNTDVFGGGLFGKGVNLDGISNQGFGEAGGGITNQSFGNDAPLGNGLLIMLMAGAGYASLKRKKTK